MNQLWYGDNLTIMQGMKKHSVDLIYLDPPFNSKQNYNLLYRTMTGKPVPEQVEAFCDTWEMDAQKEAIARSMPVLMREHGVEDYYVDFWRLWMQALRTSQPHLLAYLVFMVQRLLQMKSILRPTGSIFLHCDSTASHYIKVMMDGIFGHENFRNEIIWKRQSAHSDAKKQFAAVSDTILFYGASKVSKFEPIYVDHDEAYVEKFYRHDDKDGRGAYRLSDMASPNPRPNMMYEYKGFSWPAKGWRYQRETMERLDLEGRIYFPKHKDGNLDTSKRLALKRYLSEQKGSIVTNVWVDIPPVQFAESLGYPTQKPLPLLERIISASTGPGDVVFDPFCGCGTTIYAAVRLGRQWIGCDIAILAVKLVKETLTEKYRLVEGHDFSIDGVPTSVDGAQTLFEKDPSTFQNWFVERVGGFPMSKKTADRGIDGRIYFETRDGLREMMLQVKGGKHVRPTDVRDLRGVLEREANAEMAGFLSITPPTKAMRSEAAEAGTYTYGGVEYPRIQFLTTEDVLVGKREFHMPTRVNTKISTGQQSLAL
jgi:DNA modification methylase